MPSNLLKLLGETTLTSVPTARLRSASSLAGTTKMTAESGQRLRVCCPLIRFPVPTFNQPAAYGFCT
jgi:hypothetical protein